MPTLEPPRRRNPPPRTNASQRPDAAAVQGVPGNQALQHWLNARLRGSGQPLDAATRASMEPLFGRDLGAVRIHTGAQADAAAQSVNARAFTLGNDLVFRQGSFDPGSTSGRALLAHELAHAVQQHGASGGAAGFAGNEAEHAADRASRDVMAGRRVRPQPAMPMAIARQPQGAERPQPTLKEQAQTLQRMFAREIVQADTHGWSGIRFVVTNRGTWLEPTSMEKLGSRGERPPGARLLSESDASSMLSTYMGMVSEYGPGQWQAEFQRDKRGAMQFQGWKKIEDAAAPPPAAAAEPAEGCDETDSHYGECLAREREINYKMGIQAAGEVADAYYNPFSGPPGGIGSLVRLPGRLDRISKIEESVKRRRRHSGGGLRYTVTGPHDKLVGTSVYVLKDSEGAVLYVGKGEALNRLREHIKDVNKTQWFGEIAHVEVRATGVTNSQALALEESLIGSLKPLYNVDQRPFYKEFGDAMTVGANLPKSQPTLLFTVEWGH